MHTLSNSDSRGQISVELIVDVGIALVLLIAVILFTSMMSNSSAIVSQTIDNKSECLRLAYAITQAYSEGSGTELGFELNIDSEINSANKVILTGQEQCGFLANTSDKTLSIGNYLIKNMGGQIIIS